MEREKNVEICIDVIFFLFLQYYLKNNIFIKNYLSCFKIIYYKLLSKNRFDSVLFYSCIFFFYYFLNNFFFVLFGSIVNLYDKFIECY